MVFKTSYKKRIHAIRTNKNTSICSQHFLGNKFTYYTMMNAMKVLHLATKDKLINNFENFVTHEVT